MRFRPASWWARARRVGWAALVPLLALDALGAPKPASKLVNVADTRNLGSGFVNWVADVYNTSHWLFGLLVVVIMAGMGLVLGLLSDRVMGSLGINLGRMSHHE